MTVRNKILDGGADGVGRREMGLKGTSRRKKHVENERGDDGE